jgi:uncharacterized protein
MTYEYYQDTKKEWRWRLRADNNKTIADSAESYHNKNDCLAAIDLVKSSKSATVKPS